MNLEILQKQNRIELLRARGRDNGNIVKKLERQIRALQRRA